MNEVRISGKLGKDMVLRPTSNPNLNVGSFSIAVPKKSKKDPSGYETLWFDVTAFGSVATDNQHSLVKGAKVEITGRLDYQTWLDKESGAKRSKVCLIASELVVEQRQPEEERPYVPVALEPSDNPTFDDIPF